MTRLKTAQQAGTTYRGSASGGRFDPGRAPSKERALQEKKTRVSEEIKERSAELSRQQASQSIELNARKQANQGLLQVSQVQEYAKLKQDALNDQLNLQLQSRYEIGKANLNVAFVQAEGAAKARNLKLIGDLVKLSTSFAGDYLKYQETKAAEQIKNDELNHWFNLIDNDQPTVATESAAVEERDFGLHLKTNETAIQSVAGDDDKLANSLREPVRNEVLARQSRQLTVNEINQQLPTYWRTFVNSNETLTTPDERLITPLTVKTQEDLEFVLREALSRFAREHNNFKGLPRDQLVKVLIPTVRALYQNDSTRLGNQIAKNNREEGVRNAKSVADSNLANGKHVGSVYQELTAQLFATGEYGGNYGKAGDVALDHLLGIAVTRMDEDLLDQLENEYKVYDAEGRPNTGTQFKKIAFSKIEKARIDLYKNQEQLAKLTENSDRNRIFQALRTRRVGLAREDITNADEVLINEDAIEALEAIGTPQARLEAQRLKNRGVNYNPNTFRAMIAAQESGLVTYTNDQLEELVANKDITPKEARSLGYRPGEDLTVGQANFQRLSQSGTYKGIQGVAKGLVVGLVEGLDLDPQQKTLLANTKGGLIQADLINRMETSLQQFLTRNPDATEKDLAEKVQFLQQNLTNELKGVSFNSQTGELEGYEIGDMPGLPYTKANLLTRNTHERRTDGTFYKQLSNKSIAGIRSIASEVNLTNDEVLLKSEMKEAVMLRQAGKPYPKRIVELADALNTNPQLLIRMQGKAYDLAEFSEFVDPITAAQAKAGELVITKDNLRELSITALGKPITWRQLGRNPSLKQKILNYYTQQQ